MMSTAVGSGAYFENTSNSAYRSFHQGSSSSRSYVVYEDVARPVSRRSLFYFETWATVEDTTSSLDLLPEGSLDLLPEGGELVSMLVDMGHGEAVRQAENDLADEIEAAAQAVTMKSLRLRCGMSQRSLATMLGTAQARISRIENGIEEMSLAFAGRLASALGVDLNLIQAAVRASVRHGC